jgi:hypothetical protein
MATILYKTTKNHSIRLWSDETNTRIVIGKAMQAGLKATQDKYGMDQATVYGNTDRDSSLRLGGRAEGNNDLLKVALDAIKKSIKDQGHVIKKG